MHLINESKTKANLTLTCAMLGVGFALNAVAASLQQWTLSSSLLGVPWPRCTLCLQGALHHPEPPLHGVSQQQAPLGPHLLVLLVHEPVHLLVVCLCAEVDDVGSEAGHAALAVSGAGALLRLCVQTVECDDCVVKQLPVYLPLQLHGEPGGEPQS